jgi:high affinity Mn2+ porin
MRGPIVGCPRSGGGVGEPRRVFRGGLTLALGLLILATGLGAQTTDDSPGFFTHAKEGRFWLSGQLNVISQQNFPFRAPYTGTNSFRPGAEDATSYVVTAYAAWRASPRTEFLLNIEAAAGRGLSESFGIAGFPNLDVVRNPALPHVPYIARAEIHHVFPLTGETVDADRGPFGVFEHLPSRRIEVRAGKFDTVDVFDVNEAGGDTHFQFMNWAVDTNGAYDYAADTRGYTLGVEAEYQVPRFGVRFGELLMPKVANGIDYDFDVGEARGENLEIEFRQQLFGHKSIVKLLGFLNHARMGSYQEAIDAFRSGADPHADITAHRAPGRLKRGLGLNVEQEVTDALRIFGRLGWDDGKTESFAFTEIDDTFELGFDWRGKRWHRPGDKIGLAFVSSGLSSEHRTYLALGGLGFILGDGALTYGRETIVESYYTARLARGLYPAFDLQYVRNPGFNEARGPVWIASLRIHLEL